MRSSYLLVADELQDDATHTFDWLYHQRGDVVASPRATQTVDVAACGTGFDCIRRARVGSGDGVVHATFAVGADRTQGTWTGRVRFTDGAEESFDHDRGDTTRVVAGIGASAQLECLRREATGAVVLLGAASTLAARP
ncbi:MAG: hypothetical protein O2782_15840 [bacterium]|nr:hypothetical protein [bacterium]